MTLQQWSTWREILSQPAIWREWSDSFDVSEARRWVADLGPRAVWFCGAGTSAYIGDILAAGLKGQGDFWSVPTTDIVARPHVYLAGRPPLVVQFGRSGSSAETIGLLDALDALAPNAPRLNITCNRAGVLAQRRGPGPGRERTIVLPSATHDAGFAMTSSFSTMLLAAASVFAPDGTTVVPWLADRLEQALPGFEAGAGQGAIPQRVVFLGTGPLGFAAREAALKVLELSAGQIAALWDTPLGFRHGPKSFVQPGTRLVLFGSQDSHAARYEADLVAELSEQFSDCPLTHLQPPSGVPGTLPDLWCAPLCVALAQVWAVVWSARLGLNVDDPFAGRGTLTRVVANVRLHPVAR